MRIERFKHNPIIIPSLDPRIGDNINGPSLIRVPEWVDDRLGKYYLYFAHHPGAGSRPRSITVRPTGQFAFRANERSNDISVYFINPVTGALAQVRSSPFPTGRIQGSS